MNVQCVVALRQCCGAHWSDCGRNAASSKAAAPQERRPAEAQEQEDKAERGGSERKNIQIDAISIDRAKPALHSKSERKRQLLLAGSGKSTLEEIGSTYKQRCISLPPHESARWRIERGHSVSSLFVLRDSGRRCGPEREETPLRCSQR